MKIKLLILTSVVLITALVSAGIFFLNNKDNPRFVRDFIINEDYSISFRNPISQDEAKDVSHYFLTFDDQNRIISIQYKTRGEFHNLSNSNYPHVSKIVFEYASDHKSIKYFNLYDQPQNVKGTYGFKFETNSDRVIKTNLNKKYNPYPNDAGVLYEVLHINSDRKIDYIDFKSPYGDLESDDNLLYRTYHEYNKEGLLAKTINKNAVGEVKANKDRVAIVEYTYDHSGFISEYSYFDENSKPAVSRSMSVHKVNFEYNSNGYIVKQSGYDTNGKAMKFYGYDAEIVKFAYDNYGNIVRYEFVNEDNKLVNNKYDTAVITLEYDEKGNNIIEKYFDKNMKPSRFGIGGHTIVEEKYNEHNHRVESTRYNEEGDLQEDYDDGIALFRFEYDEKGNNTKMSFFDKNKEPKETITDQVASIEYTYDENGYLVKERYFDKNGKLKDHKEKKAAIIKYIRDENGNSIEESTYDKNESLKVNDEGVALTKYAYDEYGSKLSEQYFDSTSKPVEDKTKKLHKITYSYNSTGRLNKEVYFGLEDQRKIDFETKIGGIEYVYNDSNQIKYKKFINPKDQLTINLDNEVYAIEYIYNKYGDIAYEILLDKELESTKNRFGIGGEEYKYDEYGRPISRTFLNQDKDPIHHPNGGFSEVRVSYDEFHNKKEIAFYDKRGKRANAGHVGYSYKKLEYDKANRIVSEKFYDRLNEFTFTWEYYKEYGPVIEVMHEYDNNGNEQIIYIDIYGKELRSKIS